MLLGAIIVFVISFFLTNGMRGGVELTAAATLAFVCIGVLRFIRQFRARRAYGNSAGR